MYMLLNFVYGLIGIVLLTAYCLIGAFAAPPMAYWFMTPKAKSILEESGISRKFSLKEAISLTILIIVVCVLFLWLIINAGMQGASSGMSLLQLSLRYLILFWMTSVFDAVVLDWWMFTRTKLFGIWLQKQTGNAPLAWSVDPQWDGKEIYKLLLEILASVALAWIFLKLT